MLLCSLFGTNSVGVRAWDATLRQYVSWIEADELGGIEESLKNMTKADPHFGWPSFLLSPSLTLQPPIAAMGSVLRIGLELMGTGRTTRLDHQFRQEFGHI